MSSNPKPGITPGNLGAQLGSAVRVLSNPGKQKRLLNGLVAGSKSFLGHLSHVAHMLWLQSQDSYSSASPSSSAEHSFASTASMRRAIVGPGKSILAFFFTLIFVYFGLNSFWRTRSRQ